MSGRITYVHFDLPVKSGLAKITAATRFTSEKAKGPCNMEYGLALCSPRDLNHWDRPFGNGIAERRLKKQRNFAGVIPFDHEPNAKEVIAAIESCICEVRPMHKGGTDVVHPMWLEAVDPVEVVVGEK